MITIKDIAGRLDLSVSTVGRALTDHPHISRETKERVRVVAKELGYVANAAARVMRGGSSHLIGLLVPDIRSSFYSMVAHNLSKCFEREGFHLALSITDDDRDIESKQVRELVSARVAGVVTVPTAAPRRETLALLRTVPHVQLLRRIPALGDWFGLDEERGMLDVANHLFALGHRRVAFIGDLIFPTGRMRYDGFRRAHTEAQIKLDESFVEFGPPEQQFAGEAIERLLARRPVPTAVVLTTVMATLGVVEKLMAMKIAVPDDISIVGFGDGPWQKWWGSGLTTVRLPAEDLATGCGLWFLNRLRSKSTELRGEPYVSISPVSLVIRGSTGKLARMGSDVG
jgi:LacI family transcriptional regulator, repressor for deo operon, udp, cdd, tsx, nupC, and nupG